jgi:hypothetical protein
MLGLLLCLPHGARATELLRVSDLSYCLDSMETEPSSDDGLQPLPVAMDGGCLVFDAPVAI